MTRIGTAAALWLCCISAQAISSEQLTAGELYSFCNSKAETSVTACRFFVLGASEGLGMIGATLKNNQLQGDAAIACIPAGTDQTELVAAYKDWMKRLTALYPSDAREPAISILGAIWHKKYPCKQSSQ